jgi:membrane protease YdiL (CAAX protease family)
MDPSRIRSGVIGRTLFGVLFTHRKTIAVISIVLLGLISALPPYGVIAGWILLLGALLLCVRHGSFRDIGFRRPRGWSITLGLGLVLGVGLQLVSSVLLDPLLGRWTGTPVDLSSLDGMRGRLGPYLVMLAIGWMVGGFLEEMLFRGYLQKRIRMVLGASPFGVSVAILLPALAFGLAHSYQGLAGMISTGLMGALFGGAFVWSRENLWLPILLHGISNTLGITLIYTSWDRILNGLLFP